MLESVEFRAAGALLNSGLPLNLRAPGIFRVFGKKTLTRPIYMPTARVSVEVIKLKILIEADCPNLDDLTLKEAQLLQIKHTRTIARMLAILVIGNKRRWWKSKRLLANLIEKELSFEDMLAIATPAMLGAGTADFIDFIRLSETLRLTAPNLSQETKRS